MGCLKEYTMKIPSACGQQRVLNDCSSLEEVVQTARAVGASDIHLKAEREPVFRIAGYLLSSPSSARWDTETMNREVSVLLGGALPAHGDNFVEYCTGDQRTRVLVHRRGAATTASVRLLPDVVAN